MASLARDKKGAGEEAIATAEKRSSNKRQQIREPNEKSRRDKNRGDRQQFTKQ